MDTNNWDSRSIEHYKTVEQIKVQLRKENSNYLCRHPEIRAILRVFLHETINKKPTNIYEFAASLFNCSSSPQLVTMINQQLKCVNAELKKGRRSEYDGEMLFSESTPTHSLLTESSISATANSILRYSFVLKKKPSEN